MNVMGEKLKNEKKWHNCRKWFSFLAKSYECFLSSGNHKSMSVESAIEKLHKIAKEKEAQRSEHKWRQEEEVELLRKTKTK
jgi:hypothetical protein